MNPWKAVVSFKYYVRSSLCHSFKDKLLQRRGLPCIAAMTSFCSWLASAPPCSAGVFYSSCGKFVCRNARLTGPCPSSGRGWWRRWRALDGRWFLSKHQLSIGHFHLCEAPMLVHRESIALPAASIDSSYLIEQLNKIKRLLGSLNFFSKNWFPT